MLCRMNEGEDVAATVATFYSYFSWLCVRIRFHAAPKRTISTSAPNSTAQTITTGHSHLLMLTEPFGRCPSAANTPTYVGGVKYEPAGS